MEKRFNFGGCQQVLRPKHALMVVIMLIGLPFSSQAQNTIDWLTFASGADRTRFNLLNDDGGSVSNGHVVINSGVFAPLSPSGGILQAPFWNTFPPFIDSVSGNGTIPTTRVQVAPFGGTVNFRLEINAPDLSQMVFAVGQLFGPGDSAPHEIFLQARTLSGAAVMLEFLGTHAWDNGVRSYTQPLNWDGTKLSLSLNASGESDFAFFRIPSSAEPITELIFSVPQGYAVGTGDALEFAFGVPVPEPSIPAMLLIACAALLLSRNRNSIRSRL